MLYKGVVEINGMKYGVLQTYGGHGKSMLKIISAAHCKGLKPNNEAEIGKHNGFIIVQPSPGELWNRRVEPLQKAFGKKVSFTPEVGDRGKYGGIVEFEGKKYGVMYQYDQVKLIEKGLCANTLKDGDYMKVEKSLVKDGGISAGLDVQRQVQAQMEKQKQLEMSKSRDFEIEM